MHSAPKQPKICAFEVLQKHHVLVSEVVSSPFLNKILKMSFTEKSKRIFDWIK